MATKRRKKRHYKTGTHHSPKCSTPISYRSGWELVVAQTLDENPDVVSYEYESLKIPYKMAGKVHYYFPDFLVTYKGGRRLLVEVKRADKLTNRKVIAKATAARVWLRENKETMGDCGFEFWTNSLIEAFQKLLELKKKG
jgi:hypothetical protein